MAFRRRAFKRRARPARRGARFFRRRGMKPVMRFGQQIRSGIHYFKRTITWGSDTVVGTGFNAGNGSNGGGLTIAAGNISLDIAAASTVGANSYINIVYTPLLSNLPSIADFANLFDSYQIRKVVFKITPYTSVSAPEAADTVPQLSWVLHTCIDHDDATIPTAGEAGIDQLKQFASYRVNRVISTGRKPITIVLKPRAQGYVYNGGAVPGAEVRRSTWLDMSNLNVAHYGLKGVFECINPVNTATHFFMRCETTYYLKFKGVR